MSGFYQQIKIKASWHSYLQFFMLLHYVFFPEEKPQPVLPFIPILSTVSNIEHTCKTVVKYKNIAIQILDNMPSKLMVVHSYFYVTSDQYQNW
mmetsp:Transcript_22774/g.52177  ORF Transcript_22774/g.52177 Transcript_22774/m.52177 type:complete len:93 (-) Transcript_22774:4931-5209(-)